MAGSPTSTLGEQQGAGHDSSKNHPGRSPERGRSLEHVRPLRIGGHGERVEQRQEPEEGEGRGATVPITTSSPETREDHKSVEIATATTGRRTRHCRWE